MGRPLLLVAMSTAALAVASAMLAYGSAFVIPFTAVFGRDVSLLIQLPIVFMLLALVTGATVVERVARRMGIARSSTVAAAHLGIASGFFAAYSCFPLVFWPAFAENRFDLGFDLRHGGRWVIASWLVYLLVALPVTARIARSRAEPSRTPRIVLVAIAVVTCVAMLFAARRIHAQPRGYLATLTPVALDADGPPRTQVGSLCIWRGERPIAWTPDKKLKLYRCGAGLSFIKTCDMLLHNEELYGPFTDDIERGVSISQVGRTQSCPSDAPAGAKSREPGSVLLFDANHDVFFEPSKYHEKGTGYLAQLEGREIVTLRNVHAPPARMLFYCAIIAVLLAAALDYERWRGRALKPSSVAIVAAFAMPLLVATILGA